MITRTEAVAAFGGKPSQLAQFLHLSPSAVYKMPPDDPLPELHAVNVAQAFPDLFGVRLAAYVREIDARRDAAMSWSRPPHAKRRHG